MTRRSRGELGAALHKETLHSAPKNRTSEQNSCWPIYTRMSGLWPSMHILLANFIGLFSMMSEVSVLPSAAPSVEL